MSKELEALNEINHELTQRHIDWYADNDVDDIAVDILKDKLSENYNIIKQALTPPTEQEVCDVLSEYYNLDKYNSKCVFKNNGFYEKCSDGVLESIIENDNGNLDFYTILPPHLITLIGRFYEAQE